MSNLMYLAKALDKPEYRQMVQKSLEGTSTLLANYPTMAPRLLIPIKELLR